MNEISFKEGSSHQVIITIPDTFPLTGKQASIQVRNRADSDLDFEFTTQAGETNTPGGGSLIISDQNIILNIPSDISIGKANKFKWQLKVFTDEVDAVNFDIFDFIITPSINV